jgi:hypothetical protein
MSSLQTVHSEAADSTMLPSPTSFQQPSNSYNICSKPVNGSHHSSASAGFSQLLNAADDTNIHLGLSIGRMAPVPEDQEMDSSTSDNEGGALIVEPIPENHRAANHERWFPRIPLLGATTSRGGNAPSGLTSPLLPAAYVTPPVTHLLSNNTNQRFQNTAFDRARQSVQAVIEDDQTFEVSVLLENPCTVQDVMRIVGNADLLRLWCDPIETLIVTNTSEGSTNEEATRSSSTGDGDRAREYEGEWVEATTTALGSPPSSVGFLFSAGQTVLETLGFASYGRITMFVERRRGQVGLTIGPFRGGIHASHTITVKEDNNNGGRVRVVDRVRLTRDEEEISLSGFFGCGGLESCLSKCVLPSIAGYVSQVTSSLARLKILAENSDLSSGHSIMVVNAPRWN